METTEEIKKLPDVVADTSEMVGLKRSIAETEGKVNDVASKSTPSPEKKAKVGNNEKKYFSFFKVLHDFYLVYILVFSLFCYCAD